MKKLLLLAAFAASVASQAQVTPKVKPETLVSGKSYILVNKAQSASQYMSRTSWDGALYFLGESDSKYADYALTAIDNGDGTWSFALPTASTDEEGNATTTNNYLWIPAGSDNVNLNTTEPATWKLTDSTYPGFYQLEAVEGFGNGNCVGLKMHLNSGVQYVVISENSNYWYPDFAGGVDRYDDESTGDEIITVKDSTSFNWGFVSPENVTAYYLDLQSVGAINSLYTDYCTLDGYSDGFLKTYQACADLYNSAEYSEDDIETIKAMINGKINLYKEIDAATILNTTDDAVLNAAINNALTTFGSATDAAEVEAATATLKDAELAYSMGTGDITSLGTNMSFEDLSAQGGDQTTGVAGSPTGWNIYINGQQVVSAADVKAAGFSGWHGVNNDCVGDVKDGQMGFGIWAASIPDYEISQTMTGLENGTYEITAGLMAGSNGSGSRLTTQRIFGNLNSTYYGSEYEYNLSELDKTEVYSFAGNEIIVTDNELRPVTVRAFVYDGTLTFGVRTDNNIFAVQGREANNGAGGDGWFKTDNFKVVKKGYIPADAVAIYENYAENLLKVTGEKMATSTADKIDAAGSQEITEDTPQADIISAILSTKDLMTEAETSVKAYEKFQTALEQHYEYIDQYQQKAGIGDYSDAVMAAQEVYDDGSANTEAEIDGIIATLNAALQECIQSDDIEPGADLTDYIQNASFEDLSSQNNINSDGNQKVPNGWSLYVEGEATETVPGANWAAINSGDNISVTNTQGEEVTAQYTDGSHLWGVWSSAIPVIELSQTIKGLPAGTYTLTADIVVQNDWAGMNLGTQRLFANDYVTMFGAAEDYCQNADESLYTAFPEDVRVAAEMDALNPEAEVKHLNYAGNYSQESYGASGAPYKTTVVFGLAEAGEATIGFRSSRVSAVTGEISSQASLGWFKLDNFRLTYDSTDVPAGASTTPEETAVKNVNSAATAVQFYSVNGARLSAPQKGINIVKMSNGTVNKILVK